MDFIHIADVHLGAIPESDTAWPIERDKEIYDTFFRVIKTCEEKQIDLLLIAGDLFHRQPLLRELKEINYMFGKLTHTKVVIMAGNHDYIAMRSNYLDFKWNDNTYLFTNKDMDSIFLEELNTEVYGFSYRTRDIYEAKYDHAFCTVEERINILLAHGGDERNIPINYKQVANAGFDYVALGHIHKPEILAPNMAYSGSLEPLDKTELGDHGYIYGTIEKDDNLKTNVTIEFIPFSKRIYKKIAYPVTKETTNYSMMEELGEMVHEMGEENMYQIVLEGRRDPEIILDTRSLYALGNIVEVEDLVLPDYDFDKLYAENKGNLIGAYISRIRTESDNEELIEKALYYGIEALLNTKER